MANKHTIPYLINKALAEIKIYGMIAESEDATWDQFLTELANVADNNSTATIRINSGGGSMVKGLAMYDAIRNSACKFTGIVEGIAASMAGPLFMACDVRLMNKNARVMVHRPQGGYSGEVEGFISFADLMKQEEEKLVAIYVDRTGQTEEVVKSWFVPGAPKWFNAQDALKMGIATGIVENVKDVKLPVNVSDVKDLVQIYNAILTEEINPNNIHMKKDVIGVLNAYSVAHTLNEESTDKQFAETVENAFKAKDLKITELENKLKAQNDAAIESALTEAVDAGKITADKKADWKGILENSFEFGMSALKALAPKVDVNNQLIPGKKGEKAADERKDWNARDWETKDPEGWKAMRNENPTKFEELQNAYYGN